MRVPAKGIDCHALSSWEPLPLGRPSAESWERPQRASQPWLEGNLSWAGACAEERADSLLFLSALVVWQQDFDICSGLSCFVNSLVQLSPRLFSSGLFLRRGSAADGPAASPSILALRASGVFRQLFCSPRGPHFLLVPFSVLASERSF